MDKNEKRSTTRDFGNGTIRVSVTTSATFLDYTINLRNPQPDLEVLSQSVAELIDFINEYSLMEVDDVNA